MDYKVIILFGGTFDPIHNGHVQVGYAALERFHARRLIFIPAYRSPHKADTTVAGRHRLEMIRLAIGESDRFQTSDCELKRHDPSYTLETVRHFQNRFGDGVDLVWLVGADQLEALDRWYKIGQLLDICRIAVMYRAGYPPPDFRRFKGVFTDAQIAALKRNVVPTPLIDISSTEIRRRLAVGDSCTNILPAPVVHYIKAHHLYGFRT